MTHFSGEAHRAISAIPNYVTLYDQNDDGSGDGAVSLNFTDNSLAIYDSYAADAFTIPSGHAWKIREVKWDSLSRELGPTASKTDCTRVPRSG